MTKDTLAGTPGSNIWCPIPNGTRVRHQADGEEGIIDGLTQLVEGVRRNPDRLTQYRIDVGSPTRKLAAEQDLLIVVDHEGLVIMLKQPVEYRRHVTDRLRSAFQDNQFVTRKVQSGKINS
jgi:hypothetical protein